METNRKLLRPRKAYELVEPSEPNMMRDQFPYTEPPKILFDGTEVLQDPADEFIITDTTFRDGQQARPPYTVQQIVDLYDFMHRLGGPSGVIRQSEFFLYSAKDREAVDRCLEKGYRYPEVTGWIRAVKKDFQLVKEMGLKETGILTSASDYHIFDKLNWNRESALKNYVEIAAAAIEAGVLPRCHFEDVTRADIYGFVVPFAQALMNLAEESKVPIKIRLCDTMGYGVTYPGAALPRSVSKLVHTMVHDAGVPKAQIEWHGHNDFHKVLANASTVWLYGCQAANGTLLGFGERTGNPPIEGLIFEHIGLMGHMNGIDTTVITEIADYFRNEIGVVIPPNYPFVGSEFNVTRAGIHADGVIKNEEMYNIFDTDRLLHRPLSVNVTDKSGLAGVAFWLNGYLGLHGDARLDKNHEVVRSIAKWVEEQYKDGRTTAISNEEMVAISREYLPHMVR
ncbi:MAG: 2-isopropylmalate synthase [Firmicutes bacterium]|nr:2-isopropylmalate synthase [Bacillota bacterium]